MAILFFSVLMGQSGCPRLKNYLGRSDRLQTGLLLQWANSIKNYCLVNVQLQSQSCEHLLIKIYNAFKLQASAVNFDRIFADSN